MKPKFYTTDVTIDRTASFDGLIREDVVVQITLQSSGDTREITNEDIRLIIMNRLETIEKI